MADTFSTNLKVRLLETGAYNNVWGSVHNSDAINLLDLAIAGRSSIALGVATTYSLAALGNGTASESRSMILTFTGTPASMVTATVPGTVSGTKLFLVDNQTAQIIRIGYSTGPTVDVAAGTRRFVECDGAVPGVYSIFASASDASTLDGIDSTQFARLDIANVFTKQNSSPFRTVTENPTTVIDASLGNNFILTLTGNRTMDPPSTPADGQHIFLLIQQDGTGGRTLTWNSVFLFESAAAPILAATAGALDLFVMVYNTALVKWVVGHFGNIASGGGAAYTYSIAENTLDWNLAARVGSPGGAITVNITIQPGVIVQASCPDTAAMDLSGLPVGSTVNVFNNGYLLGKGGDGGDGAALFDQGAGLAGAGLWAGDAGQGGGNAVLGPGLGRTLNITNASGFIWGGGGGGGGGGASGPAAACIANGGGGGGGAGGGALGRGGKVSTGFYGSDGGRGSTGPNGTAGAGGPGNNSGGSGASGGGGGDWGTAGTAGTTAAALASNLAAGVAGPAGKAVEPNGGSANFLSGSGGPNVKGAIL